MVKSYYKTIKGVRYDRHMLEVAEESVAGQGDGRISIDDAQKLFESIIDGNRITDIENRTLEYIRENFRFTKPADEWLTRELEKWWSDKQKPLRKTVLEEKEKPVIEQPYHPAEPMKQGSSKQQGSPAGTNQSSIASEEATVQKILNQKSETAGQKPKSSALKFIFLLLILIVIIVFVIFKSGSDVKDESIAKLEPKTEKNELKAPSPVTKVNKSVETVESVTTEQEKAEPPANHRMLIIEKLEKNLGKKFVAKQVQFDKENLLLLFQSPGSPFKTGSSKLSSDYKKTLSDIFPELIKILATYNQARIKVVFQGHSSSKWDTALSQDEAYQKNLELSKDRAKAALAYCKGLPEIQQYSEWVNSQLSSAGLSNIKPVLSDDGKEDQERSKRITLSLQVIEEE